MMDGSCEQELSQITGQNVCDYHHRHHVSRRVEVISLEILGRTCTYTHLDGLNHVESFKYNVSDGRL